MKTTQQTRKPIGLVLLISAVLIAACTADVRSDPPEQDDGPFWALLTFPGVPVEEYASISEMAVAADLVVLGTVGNVTLGREWGDPREQGGRAASLLIQLKIVEVLAGDLPPGTTDSVTLEHLIAGWSREALATVLIGGGVHVTASGRPGGSATPVAPVPTTRAVFFLRQLEPGPQGAIVDYPSDAVLAGGIAYQLITPQGLIIEEGDKAAAPLSAANIALDSEGHPFELQLPEQFLAEEIARSTFTEVVAAARH